MGSIRIDYALLAWCSVACAAEGQDPYRSVLEVEFPEYEVHEVVDTNQLQRRHSKHSFHDDILVGDFNLDGHIDFATLLVRDATKADLETIPAKRRSTAKSVFLAVVCNGAEASNGDSVYKCTTISKQRVGGFDRELDYIDWGRQSGLIAKGEASGNPSCSVFLESASNKHLLTFREPIGHCTTFFSPDAGGGYSKCVYCVD